MSRMISVVALIAAFAAPSLTAQIPPGTRYVVTYYFDVTNSIRYLDANGVVTTMVVLTAGGSTDTVANAPTNDAMIVFDTTGLHTIPHATLSPTFTTLTGRVDAGCIDEAGGAWWCNFAGEVYRSSDLAGSNTTLLRRAAGLAYSAVAWNGSTGGVVACAFLPYPILDFIARDGTVTRSLVHPRAATGIDWSPWNGDLWISRRTRPSCLRMTQSGVAVSIGIVPIGLDATDSVEVREQPTERILCAEFGLNPNGIYAMGPSGRSLSTFGMRGGRGGPSDATFIGQRQIWGTSRWRVGRTGRMSLNFGPDHGADLYQVALSFGHAPGLPLGPIGTLHLSPDPLFFLTVSGVPGLFNNFSGRLQSSGKAVPAPHVRIPARSELNGLRVYGSAIIYNARGIRRVSNAWGISIER